jgi:signal peptidase II
MTPKQKVLLFTIPIALVADVVSKAWVVSSFGETERHVVIDGFFNMTHVRNPGVAFGLLSSLPDGLRTWVLGGLSMAAAALMIGFFRVLAPGDRQSACGLGLILGGAMGNFFDRINHGAVLDFLHFELWGRYSWPSFNLADLFIVTGVGALMFELVASEAARRSRPEDTD